MKIITETERLYLREFTTEDTFHFYNLNLDDEVIKYTGDSAFKSEAEAKNFIINYKDYKLHKMGRWAVCDKNTNEFLGWCGLKLHPNSKISQPFVEVGYRFYKKHWNKGFATESCKAAITFGFNTLNLSVIFAHAHKNNLASHRVLQKCGLHFVNEDIYDEMPAYLFKIENPNT